VDDHSRKNQPATILRENPAIGLSREVWPWIFRNTQTNTITFAKRSSQPSMSAAPSIRRRFDRIAYAP